MALPIVIPAIAKGAAALSAALGFTALVSSKTNDDKTAFDTSRIKTAFVQQNMPLVIAAMEARRRIGQPTPINIPTAENALVLRPEYRTVTTPVEYIGYKPLFNSTEVVYEDSASQEDTTRQQSSAPSPKPNDEKPKDDKGFKKGLKKGWEHTKKIGNTIGTGLGYGIGFGVPVVGTGLGAYGLYKLFSSDKKDNNTNDEDGVSLKPMTWAK